MASIRRIADMQVHDRDSAWIRQQIIGLESYWSRFSSEHEDILSFANNEDRVTSYYQENSFQAVEDLYTETVSKFNMYLTCKHVDKPSCASQQLKLPTIEVPKFNGNLNNWISFYDTFKRMVHENDALNDVQRMHYLKGSVVGTAAALIRHL